MPEFTIIQQICIWALPVLFAITLHEVAHGWVANACGDSTAKMLGRLSLNPLRHIDLVGTIIIPLVTGLLTQFSFVFGYAKPVPVNWAHLRRPKRDMILVSLAGPAANLLMAFIWTGILKLSIFMHPTTSMVALFMLSAAKAGILINLVLAFLNLLPIPPLDGSKVILSLLSPRQSLAYLRFEPYGFIILVLLMYTNVLGYILSPLITYGYIVLFKIYQLL